MTISNRSLAHRPPGAGNVRAGVDQAAGLRSLLGRRTLRLLPLFAGRDRRAQGACAAHLARTLALSGLSVVLLDASGDALAALGIAPRNDLMRLIEGEQEFGDVAVQAGPKLRCISAIEGLPALIQAAAATEDFFEGFMRQDEPAELLVLNLAAMPDATGRIWSPMQGQATELLMLMAPGEQALTATYAVIKQMQAAPGTAHTGHAPAFRVLINGASGEREARAACRLLADTARRFLGAAVTYAGNLPRSNAGAALGTVPGAPHADAARAIARLAADVPGWRLAECALDESAYTQSH